MGGSPKGSIEDVRYLGNLTERNVCEHNQSPITKIKPTTTSLCVDY